VLPNGVDARTDATNALADTLFQGGALLSQTISVAPAAADATVSVDGIVVDVSAPVAGLAVGPHVVEVRAKRYLTQRLPITISTESPAPLAVVLEIDPSAEVEVIDDDVIVVPFIAAGVSAAVAIVGGAMLAIGLDPYFRYQNASAELAGLDDSAAGYPALAEQAHKDSAGAVADWESYGSPLTVSGGVALGLGVSAAIATLSWGTVLLLSPPETREGVE
jgi:hypothetical protein